MTRTQWSALLSTGAALVIVVATFWQWWDITWDGGMRMRRWVRWVLAVVAVGLLTSAILAVIGD